jgi:hypothetical protein
MYDLKPDNNQKSFYGKARVRYEDNKIILKSYNTDVCFIEDGKPVVEDTYSPTTLKHIKSFLRQEGFKADTKKQIMEDYKPQKPKPQKPNPERKYSYIIGNALTGEMVGFD